MPKAPGRNAGAATEPAPTPFRFYDNRQKYLAFVTACNEKSAIARRAADELARLQPTPPAVRLFDAGMGDRTVLANGWQTMPSPTTGNPLVVRPSVLVIYREDHRFLLDAVIPTPRGTVGPYDLVLASQPWRARMGADFKVQKVLAPLARSLAPGGKLLAIQSCGHDPGLEIIQQLWPGEQPFQVSRHELLATLRRELAGDSRHYDLSALPDDEAIFRYEMHTLPSEIGDRIGTSTLFAAWNAAIYVNQIEDERLDAVVTSGAYLEATQRVLRKHGGLWFNDEAVVVARRRD